MFQTSPCVRQFTLIQKQNPKNFNGKCESAVYRHSSFFLLLRPSFNLLKSKIDCDSYFILGLSQTQYSTKQTVLFNYKICPFKIVNFLFALYYIQQIGILWGMTHYILSCIRINKDNKLICNTLQAILAYLQPIICCPCSIFFCKNYFFIHSFFVYVVPYRLCFYTLWVITRQVKQILCGNFLHALGYYTQIVVINYFMKLEYSIFNFLRIILLQYLPHIRVEFFSGVVVTRA